MWVASIKPRPAPAPHQFFCHKKEKHKKESMFRFNEKRKKLSLRRLPKIHKYVCTISCPMSTCKIHRCFSVFKKIILTELVFCGEKEDKREVVRVLLPLFTLIFFNIQQRTYWQLHFLPIKKRVLCTFLHIIFSVHTSYNSALIGRETKIKHMRSARWTRMRIDWKTDLVCHWVED